MRFRLSIVGFAILALMVIWLFFLSFVNSLQMGFGFLVVAKLLILLLLLHQLRLEWQSVLLKKEEILGRPMFDREGLLQFLAVVVGTLAAFFLSHQYGLGAVLASSVVGLGAALFIPRLQVPAYCGSFVGMACDLVFFTYFHITLAGLLGGLLFVLGRRVLNGFGGKLGTIAFFGTVGASFLTVSPLRVGDSLSWDLAVLVTVYSVLGAVLTYIIGEQLNQSVVFASGFMGFLGGVMLPFVYPEVGEVLAVVFFCASFAGMSSLSRLPGEKYVAIAGLFSALIFVYSFPLFDGSGGKLGTIAFGATIAVGGYVDIKTRVKEWFRRRDKNRIASEE